jgi:hypothetical protein
VRPELTEHKDPLDRSEQRDRLAPPVRKDLPALQELLDPMGRLGPLARLGHKDPLE